jgi:hypothetical protein
MALQVHQHFMLIPMLLGQAIPLIDDMSLAIVSFLVARQWHGNPSDKLQFLGLVLKLN